MLGAYVVALESCILELFQLFEPLERHFTGKAIN